jgi:hypothetical protein
MPLNIIVKSGGRKKISDEEMADYLAKRNNEALVRDKATYRERSREIRKAAEKMKLPNGFRVKGVYDAKMLHQHEIANPGCSSDPGYLKELRKDNPEMNME